MLMVNRRKDKEKEECLTKISRSEDCSRNTKNNCKNINEKNRIEKTFCFILKMKVFIQRRNLRIENKLKWWIEITLKSILILHLLGAASKNTAYIKSGQKWAKHYHLTSFIKVILHWLILTVDAKLNYVLRKTYTKLNLK